jgi:periplasmic copper chaperone A
MRRLLGTAALVAAIGGMALAADRVEVGGVMIVDAWARASLGTAPNSAAYMTLEATGAEGDRLIGGATPAAERVELHVHLMEGDIARMRQVDAVEVAPGAPTVLAPGGLHVMLVGLTAPLEEGATLPLTLVFEGAGEVLLEVPVHGLRAAPPGHHGSHGHGG